MIVSPLLRRKNKNWVFTSETTNLIVLFNIAKSRPRMMSNFDIGNMWKKKFATKEFQIEWRKKKYNERSRAMWQKKQILSHTYKHICWFLEYCHVNGKHLMWNDGDVSGTTGVETHKTFTFSQHRKKKFLCELSPTKMNHHPGRRLQDVCWNLHSQSKIAKHYEMKWKSSRVLFDKRFQNKGLFIKRERERERENFELQRHENGLILLSREMSQVVQKNKRWFKSKQNDEKVNTHELFVLVSFFGTKNTSHTQTSVWSWINLVTCPSKCSKQ